MNRIYRLLLLLIIACSFFQCQKDLSYYGDPDPTPVIPVINKVDPEPITANLQGNILDENSQPAQGVSITVGNKTATTNAKGYFRIIGAPLDKKSALVTAEKSGYFKGYRVFAATSGTNEVVIKLIKKNLAGTLTATTGGDATLSNGAKITLPANAIITASNNNAYTGNVKVYAAYIDPTANDIVQTVPGSFAANDSNGSRVTLSSYGMMAVTLEGDSGEKLQIKDGSTATLTTPIPVAQQASAPASISMWSVDETTGLWKQEGSAAKQGNNYVSAVKHFSFWNCDVPINAVFLSMTLNNTDSLPLVYTIVKITRSGSSGITTTYGYTDSLGQVSGMVPANETLTVEVLSRCYTVIYTQTIQPLTQNTTLGTIYVSSSSILLLTVTGTITGCTGIPLTGNAYAIIDIGNQVYFAGVDSTGTYSVAMITCNAVNTITVIGVDNSIQQQSTSVTVNTTSPITTVPAISACGTSSAQYINYTLDGATFSIVTPADSVYGGSQSGGSNGYSTNFRSNSTTQVTTNMYLNFNSPTAAAGSYSLSYLSVNGYDSTFLIAPFNVNITQFPTIVGDFYEGNFTGSFNNGSSTVHNINATFRIRRNY